MCDSPCAEAGHTHCVQSLLKRGASPNTADAEGTTPLLAALAGGYRRTAEALLAAGAQTGGRTGELHAHMPVPLPLRVPLRVHQAPAPAQLWPQHC